MFVSVLGPLQVSLDRSPVRILGRRRNAFLAILLLRPGVAVSVDRLTELLWAKPPASSRQQVYNTAWSLRQSLGLKLVFDGSGYSLDIPADRVDSFRFAALVDEAAKLSAAGLDDSALARYEEALGLWNGDAFAEIDCEPVRVAATQLEEQRISATERAAWLKLRSPSDGGTQLISQLTELVASYPLRESLRAVLIEALHAAGRTAEALLAYEGIRRLLADELGVQPGAQLQALHVRLLQNEPPVAVVGPMLAPRNFLPRTVGDFTGRSEQLKALAADALAGSAPALVVSAIDGMGGVGKTALAVRLAHDLAGEYPDGQFFIDLHGFTAGLDPVDPRQALGDLLRDAGVPIELIPRDADARAALWRSRMAGKRAIVLLDNAVDAQQVRQLLPGTAGVLAVITSRRRLAALEGALPLSLDVLESDESVELFRKVAGPDRIGSPTDALRTVVELCGRLPLAIRIAAARFRERSTWQLGHLIQQLESHRNRTRFLATGDQSVAAALTVSYRHLSKLQQDTFRILSVHPGADYDAAAVAALSGRPVEEAEDALDGLFEASMLVQTEPGRYQFHDLVRDASRDLCERHGPDNARRAAALRLVDHYLDMAVACCARLGRGPFTFGTSDAVPPPGSPTDALAFLETEHRNIVAVALLAEERGWPDRAWQLICAMQPLFSSHNYGGDAIELFEMALADTLRAGDRRGQAVALTGLAVANRERGSMDKARDGLRQAIDLTEQVGELGWLAYQWGDLGIIQLSTGHADQAYRSFGQALASAERALDATGQRAMTVNLGLVCRELGRFDEAMAHFDKALEHTDDSPIAIFVALNVGYTRFAQGHATESLVHFDSAQQGAQEHQLPHVKALAHAGTSAAQRSLGRSAIAVDAGRRSLETCRDYALREIECEALCVLAEALLADGDFEAADRLFREGAETARSRGYANYQARAALGLAHLAQHRGDRAEARKHLKAAAVAKPTDFTVADGLRTHLDDPQSTCIYCWVA